MGGLIWAQHYSLLISLRAISSTRKKTIHEPYYTDEKKKKKKQQQRQATLDQYEEYIADPPISRIDSKRTIWECIRFWKNKECDWPELAQLAFDALSIPAMSAECERCFSSGRLNAKSCYQFLQLSFRAFCCAVHGARFNVAGGVYSVYGVLTSGPNI